MMAQRQDFILSPTLALDEGWVVNSTPRPNTFTPEKDTLYSFYRRLGGPLKCRPHWHLIPGPSIQ